MNLLTAICLSLIAPFIAAAQTPELLYSFTNTAGNPNAPLAEGPDGALYGTTTAGNGTVFRITGSGEFTVIGNFNRTNGRYPAGSGLTLAPDLNFYSTTYYGGSGDVGVLFRVSTNGGLTKLVDFTGDNDAYPTSGGITLGNDGNLYGLTMTSGAFNYFATAYKIATGGALTVLARFTNSLFSAIPYGHLTLAPDGYFYGGTYRRIFRMSPSGVVTTVANVPMEISISGFTLGNDGLLYGLAPHADVSYSGAIFRVATDGTFAVITGFNGTNGELPSSRMTLAEDGTFYGTTIHGGDFGEGTIFHVTPDGALTTLFSFSRTNQLGFGAYGGVVLASDGWLYGTTMFGGNGGAGVVYRLLVDSDGDGVPDDRDLCTGTAAGSPVDEHGCSIDQLVPCDGPITGGTWKNHGQYVTAFTTVADSFLAKGLITAEQWRALVQSAARSQCGKK
jgi:uncharacterized repeat protein (TIGR03803 family)